MTTNEHDQAVFAIAENQAKAVAIVERLRNSGFPSSHISLVMANPQSHVDIAVEGRTKAPEGATAGGASGAVLGGVLGWMAGIGLLAIPGLGPFIAAGPIMAALSGAAIGGAAGGVTGGLVGLGFSEYEAMQYEGYLKKGKALISVLVADAEQTRRAKEIFHDEDAEHVSVQNVVHSAT
jgi:hypothetical protein